MANLEVIKDPRSIASLSALVAVGVSYVYFNNEISKLRQEQEEISNELNEFKHHIAKLLASSPESSQKIEKIMNAVKMLDNRIGEIRGAADVDKKGYKRLTARDVIKEDYVDDLDEDIAAMTA